MKKQETQLLVNILALAKKLMVIPSTHKNVASFDQALDLVKKELADIATIEVFESNGLKSLLIHNSKKGTRQFKVILNGHLDVVPAKKKSFKPFEKDGKLYGRGSYDMKGAVAVMTLLFKELTKKVTYPLALQVVTDEETGGFDGANYQIQQGLRGDFVITGDCGSDLNIVTEAKGIMWLKLHTSGTKAHGAYLWRGENALWKLHHDLHALYKVFPVPSKEAWITTMNLAKIETTNGEYNHVPDQATAYLDVRFIAEDQDTIIDKIKAIVSPDTEIDISFSHPPEFIAPDNHYVQLLESATKEILGKQAPLKALHAPSDVRHFNKVGCYGVQFGPKGVHQHSEDEWVEIKSLEEYYCILEHFLLSLN